MLNVLWQERGFQWSHPKTKKKIFLEVFSGFIVKLVGKIMSIDINLKIFLSNLEIVYEDPPQKKILLIMNFLKK